VAGHGDQVSLERLRQLLDAGEALDLDFKATCDLSERAELVAITKDIAAMSAQSGHLVVGVEEDGSPSGRLSAAQAKLFDEATLRSKIAPKYLPETLSITSAVHEIDGAPVALVYVAPHYDGFLVMAADGNFTDGAGTQRQEFRTGDVFVRRGSSSRKWNHEEAQAALGRAVAARKETWRAQLAEDLAGLGLAQRGQQIAEGPAGTFTWQLDADAFSAALIELLRSRDDIAIRLAFDGARRDATGAWRSGDMDTLRTVLDRLAQAAALGVSLERRELLERCIEELVAIYNLPYGPGGFPQIAPGQPPAAALWLEVITRVYAVGALAVRRRRWADVTALALQKGAGQEFGWFTNWLRAALTEAARANLLQARQDERQVELSLLSLAAGHVERLASLRPDVAPEDDTIISSLTQFDLLAILAAIAHADDLDDRGWYTNFARYDWSRSEPALVALLTDGSMRETVFPRDDEFLAQALREIARMAKPEGFRFSVWGGWHSDAVMQFLERNPPLDTR
jgi:hypothetical protein